MGDALNDTGIIEQEFPVAHLGCIRINGTHLGDDTYKYGLDAQPAKSLPILDLPIQPLHSVKGDRPYRAVFQCLDIHNGGDLR